MNWLAHILLSETDIHFQLGNVLADVMKGRVWEGIRPKTVEGMRLHLRIDAFTDAHLIFARSKRRIGEAGYLRGVAIDLAYDHMLSRNWDRFCDRGLGDFLARFYEEAGKVIGEYPETARAFVEGLIESDRLGRYGEVESVRHAMERIDHRLSARVLRKENTVRYYVPLLKERERIERDFLAFFPLLQDYALSYQWRDESLVSTP